MAKVRVQNRTTSKLVVPRPLNFWLKQGEAKEVEVVEVDKTFNDPRISDLVDKGHLKLTLLEDDTPDSGATLPFYTTANLPDPTANPGMMVFNTTEQAVMYSDGTSWLVVTVVPVFRNSNMPNPGDLPDGYLIYNTDNQVLWLARAGTWHYTTAGGIRHAPSHHIPPAGTVPRGAMFFDTDNEQLRVSDGANWQLINNVQDYSTVSGLPAIGDVGFGALGFTSRDSTLWIRYSSEWRPCMGILRFFPTYGDLPTAGWANDERGAIAYINDDRTLVLWDGKYWIRITQVPVYKTADMPDPANYANGHLVINGDRLQLLWAGGGSWRGITAIAHSYTAGNRPANATVPEGTMIWNLTSNKANYNIGGQWLDALGVVDP